MDTKPQLFGNKSQGFSLIELCVVIAIIGVLVSLSLPMFKSLRSVAKDTEGAINSKILSQLMVAYYNDEADRQVGTLMTTMPVSRNDFTTDTSCLTPNPLGFTLTSCLKINFVYIALAPGGAGNKSQTGIALEGGTLANKRVYPGCKGASIWKSVGGVTTHVLNPRDGASCLTCYHTKLWASMGQDLPAYDWDLSGVVDLPDAAIHARTGTMSPWYGEYMDQMTCSSS